MLVGVNEFSMLVAVMERETESGASRNGFAGQKWGEKSTSAGEVGRSGKTLLQTQGVFYNVAVDQLNYHWSTLNLLLIMFISGPIRVKNYIIQAV